MSPPSGGSHSFEARLTSLTPTIATIKQNEPGRTPPFSQVQMIGDELLVSSNKASDVQGFLTGQSIQFARLTSLLDGLKVPPAIKALDVEVWKLLPGFKPMASFLPDLWNSTLANDQRAATANHVLVPAGWADQCPYGPPVPTKSETLRHPEGDHEVPVTVIDAGYQWNPKWGPNPLARMAQITKTRGQHPKPLPEFKKAFVPTRGNLGDLTKTPFQASWADDSLDVPDANLNKRLDALAGHGNFVIGVLAQYTNFPDVRLYNHFGGFYPDPDEYIRELSVCRSLIRSSIEPKTPSPLINLGFSFVPLKQPNKDHVLSHAWDTVFRVLGTDPDKLLMLTPAGNQGSNVWHYPAALNKLYPGQYPNVWGVASHDPGKQTRSLWSNHGNWVKCSAIGSDVRSTFLHVKMPTEDDGDKRHPVHDFTQNNLAIWSGTCFAAPKITGMLAGQYAVTNSLNQAWQNLVSTGGHIQTTDIGVVFQV